MVCLKKVISELNERNIEEVILQGVGKLASVPADELWLSAVPAAGSAPTAATKKKDRKSEESDEHMGFCLFD